MRFLFSVLLGLGACGARAAEFPLDLRGMLRAEGQPLVNVVDPATNESMWIAVGQEFRGWTFDGLDAREARARFTQAGETVEVDLIASVAREGTEAEPVSYTLPPLRLLSTPEAGALALGLRLLLSNASNEAWMDFARRENLTIQRGPVGEDGVLSYAYAVNEPGDVPEVRPVPVPEDGATPMIGLTDDHVWILVHARPKGPNEYSVELGKFPRSRPSAVAPPLLPAPHEGEAPAVYGRRLQAAFEEFERQRHAEGRVVMPPTS